MFGGAGRVNLARHTLRKSSFTRASHPSTTTSSNKCRAGVLIEQKETERYLSYFFEFVKVNASFKQWREKRKKKQTTPVVYHLLPTFSFNNSRETTRFKLHLACRLFKG